VKHRHIGGIGFKGHDTTSLPNQARSQKGIKANVGADIVKATTGTQVPKDFLLNAGLRTAREIPLFEIRLNA
jgi:hypothetical protein